MSSFFSQLQYIPNTWWHLVKLSSWPGPFGNFFGEYYRREDLGLIQMNQMLQMATHIRRSFLAGLLKSIQPIQTHDKPPAGTTVEDLPEPSTKDCQLPGG